MIKMFIMLAAAALSLQAKDIRIEKPTEKKSESFAIVIDSKTLSNAREAVDAYRDALEDDGLATYIVSASWENPSQVRSALVKLYSKARNLEGIVLVGDIPVVMVRNAQHMTTAFKMDEEKFPVNESSVASDRFYDDLHLKFDYLGRDSVHTHHFYYKLREDSPQSLNLSYYSGRIMYPESLGGDKYEAIAKFLYKAAEAKRHPDDLDNMVTFNGSGYNSDCLVAFADQRVAMSENFPQVGKTRNSLKELNFRMDTWMKYRIFDELQRPEVDAFLFNEHGSIDKQHISETEQNPSTLNDCLNLYKWGYGQVYDTLDELKETMSEEEAIAKLKADCHLEDNFFDDYRNQALKDSLKALSTENYAKSIISLEDLEGFNPQPRFVMFNACYNGSFHRETGNIASYYIFADAGKTVCCQGNTVNVLQDKWTYEMVGLLSLGVRAGQYNKQIATLEGHIVGDPTFHFKAIGMEGLGDKIASCKDVSFWKSCLDSEYAPAQAVALRRLSDLGAISSEELLSQMQDNKFATVRMEALKLLSKRGGKEYVEALKLAFHDSYEYVRRSAAIWCGKNGDPSLASAVAEAYEGYPESERMHYDIGTSAPMFENSLGLKAFASGEKMKLSNYRKITDKSVSESSRISAARMVRNNPYHQYVDDFLKVIADNEDSAKVRTVLAEALGWYDQSYRKADVISGCQEILKDKTLPEELRLELEQTINRLK